MGKGSWLYMHKAPQFHYKKKRDTYSFTDFFWCSNTFTYWSIKDELLVYITISSLFVTTVWSFIIVLPKSLTTIFFFFFRSRMSLSVPSDSEYHLLWTFEPSGAIMHTLCDIHVDVMNWFDGTIYRCSCKCNTHHTNTFGLVYLFL